MYRQPATYKKLGPLTLITYRREYFNFYILPWRITPLGIAWGYWALIVEQS